MRLVCISAEAVWTSVWGAGDGGAAQRSAGQLSLPADLELHRLLLLGPRLLQPDAARGGNPLEVGEKREVGGGEGSDTGTVERIPLVELVADLAVVAGCTGQAAGDHAVGLLLPPASHNNHHHHQQ